MLRQHFENTTSDLEATLGRLVRIGGCADDDWFAGEELEILVTSVTECSTQNLRRIVLD